LLNLALAFLVFENARKDALNQLGSEKKKLIIVFSNATHKFEEPGALEEVARLVSGSFTFFSAF
jgi:hypothetical protein